MKSVSQETPMGCGIACVASIIGGEFDHVIKNSDYDEEKSWNQGYFCRELVKILKDHGLEYKFSKITPKNKDFIKKERSIVFVKGNVEIFGHYLVRFNGRWMDPWINFPKMNPSKAGWVKKLPDKPKWIIYREDND